MSKFQIDDCVEFLDDEGDRNVGYIVHYNMDGTYDIMLNPDDLSGRVFECIDQTQIKKWGT